MHVHNDPTIAQSINAAQSAIAGAHRKPANLREAAVGSAHSLLTGALAVTSIAPEVERERVLETFSVLTPSLATAFVRSPLQILARLDSYAGGAGVPDSPDSAAARRLQQLAAAVRTGAIEASAVLHGEILGRELFGSRSAVVGFAASRLAAMASGLDPKGLAIPEPYALRNTKRHTALLQEYCSGEVMSFMLAHFDAWRRGGEEAARVADNLAG